MAKRGRPRKNANAEDDLKNVKQVGEIVDDIVNEIEENYSDNNLDNNSDNNLGTNGGYNPLMENVVERDYSTPQVAVGDVADIDESSFVPPSYDDIIADRQQEQFQSEPSPFDNPNPAYNELEDKDKKIATESLVDTCLDAYEQLHKYAEYVIKVDEDELMQKQVDGKLDLNIEMPVSENGDTMTLGEFVGQYNEQSSTAIKYDKEFGYKVRPAMIRVFMKRGWGMSDEQYLLYMFGKDIAVKVGIMYSLKKTINSTLETMEKIHKRQRTQSNVNVVEKEVVRNQESQFGKQNEEYDDIIHIKEEDIEEVSADKFTQGMDINMPQNPKDPMSEHPKEIKTQLRKEKKGNNNE